MFSLHITIPYLVLSKKIHLLICIFIILITPNFLHSDITFIFVPLYFLSIYKYTPHILIIENTEILYAFCT